MIIYKKGMTMPTNNSSKNNKSDDDYEILIGIPCFICDILDRCGVGQEHSPIDCKNFNSWLKQKLIKFE
ncbi:MAG: hypothetical protein ACXAEU_01290 [Candidatus Hodarchaeales archaeon]